ncbi:MAG: glycosyl hydrolase family 39 [Acidobacteriaceae bacterium]|nr:glycosyl hydrolase family 39 [Acidobacteriaceae bacterium]MBV9937232.1 glycosyl hydrolase family 39 [Acidobacteriaceae bacterium]
MKSEVRQIIILVVFTVGIFLSFSSTAYLTSAQTGSASGTEVITIDSSAPSHAFPHMWEQIFGSGRAVLTLRQSYRDDLRAVEAITGFQYIRFHAIFHDENGVYDEDQNGKSIYNFSYVDQIYDGLLDAGVKPFVELSFMPRKLAANLTPHPFWYKPFPSPPKDPAKWTALIEAFTQHLIDRYGRNEVEQWYFEVWNEPNIDFWNGEPKQATYFALYDETAKAVKSVDAKLRVGGPATAQAAWVDQFIAHCTENHIPFDFVSTHVYGNEASRDVFGKDLPITRRDMVARSAKKVFDQVKASAAPNTPIIWSEYNATYLNQPEVTDSAFMGPWLANNIRECDGLATSMSYWDLSDVFEEQGVVKTPFYGGYGLIAERNIPKAAFRVFELLHRLGNQRLEAASENALVTKRSDGAYVVALWNYAEPKEESASRTFQLALKGVKAKNYRMQVVAPGSGSALEAWTKMGSPISPIRAQIEELKKSSELLPAQKLPVSKPIILGPQTLAVLEIQ